jgi:hypothetical protein
MKPKPKAHSYSRSMDFDDYDEFGNYIGAGVDEGEEDETWMDNLKARDDMEADVVVDGMEGALRLI